MHSKAICIRGISTGTGALVTLLMAAFSASAPAHGEEEVTHLETVVITAEKIEEDLQKAPISVTALSGDDLKESGVGNTMDLPMRAPGFLFSTNAMIGMPYIRGVGSDIVSIGSDATIGVFVDGVYQSRAVATLVDLYDVERVELVRGPQGTIYGRNVMGGALNIVSKTPGPDFSAAADLIYGTYGTKRGEAVVNAPLAGDKVFVRLSGMGTSSDGYTDVVNLGTHNDGENLWGTRDQLLWLLSDKLELLLSADTLEENSSRAGP